MIRPQRSWNDATGYEYFKKYKFAGIMSMIRCQLELTSGKNYLGIRTSDDCLFLQGHQEVLLFMAMLIWRCFCHQIVDLCRRFLTRQTKSDKEEGAARQHCAHKPLKSANPSGNFIPKQTLCTAKKEED